MDPHVEFLRDIFGHERELHDAAREIYAVAVDRRRDFRGKFLQDERGVFENFIDINPDTRLDLRSLHRDGTGPHGRNQAPLHHRGAAGPHRQRADFVFHPLCRERSDMQAFACLDPVDDIGVHVIAADVHRKPRDDSVQRQHRRVGHAASDVETEDGICFAEHGVRAERGEKGRLHKAQPFQSALLRQSGVIFPKFRRSAARHGKDGERTLEHRRPDADSGKKFFQHRFCQTHVHDFALVDGKDDLCKFRRLSHQLFRVLPDRLDLAVHPADRNARRLRQHDAASRVRAVNFRHRRSEINRKFYHTLTPFCPSGFSGSGPSGDGPPGALSGSSVRSGSSGKFSILRQSSTGSPTTLV